MPRGGGRTDLNGSALIILIGGAISTIIVSGTTPHGGWSTMLLGLQHHPEWIGDYDDKHQWRDVNWWTAKDPGFIREKHPDWLSQVQAGLGPQQEV